LNQTPAFPCLEVGVVDLDFLADVAVSAFDVECCIHVFHYTIIIVKNNPKTLDKTEIGVSCCYQRG